MYKLRTSQSVKIGFSQQNTKHNNTMLLFNLIRKYSPISRINLAKMTGLSATTVSLLVEELMYNNLVMEIGCGDTSMRGRKPILLQINGEGAYIAVVEIINTGVNCYIYNLLCERVASIKYRIKNGRKKLTDIIIHILKENNISNEKLVGININYPGIIDKVNKKVVYSTVIPSDNFFGNDDIEELKKCFESADLEINNNSSIAAYAAFLFSGYHYDKTVLYINMFEAIGAGAIIINKKGERIYDYPVEIGHIMVDSTAPKCKCGNRGCFEQLAGTCEILRRINKETDLSFEYSEEFFSEKNAQCMKMLGTELKAGNKQVIKVLDDIAKKTAIAITSVNNILDPGDIFIGGHIKHLGEPFIGMVRKKVSEMNGLPSASAREIHLSQIDSEARAKGAASMIMDSIFAIQDE